VSHFEAIHIPRATECSSLYQLNTSVRHDFFSRVSEIPASFSKLVLLKLSKDTKRNFYVMIMMETLSRNRTYIAWQAGELEIKKT